MGLTMVHGNPARIDNGILKVDRKFHVGMLAYAEKIRAPITSINPEAPLKNDTIDVIDVPYEGLPYRILTIKTDRRGQPQPGDIPALRDQIIRSRLVYGAGLGSSAIARAAGIPYILWLEYDLATQIVNVTSRVTSPPRRAVRAIRRAWNYAMGDIPEMRRAHSLHCNGYPIYDATRRYNSNSLLYFDSRMSSEMIVSQERLTARLATRAGRPLRLLYSGRFERMKGVDDAVRVAVECLRRGLDIEMHFYGQGSLRAEMEKAAANSHRPERIKIHDAVPYPELVKISQTFDVFVCCHIQSDPSCTYLESFGAGLPIVGYGNRMWQRLSEASGVGYVSPMGRPERVADSIQRLLLDADGLSAMSVRAVEFARQHSFEFEFEKRIAALNAAMN